MGCSHATPKVEAKSVDCRRPAPATTSFSHCKSPAGTGPGYHSSKRNWDKGSSDRQFAIPRAPPSFRAPGAPSRIASSHGRARRSSPATRSFKSAGPCCHRFSSWQRSTGSPKRRKHRSARANGRPVLSLCWLPTSFWSDGLGPSRRPCPLISKHRQRKDWPATSSGGRLLVGAGLQETARIATPHQRPTTTMRRLLKHREETELGG